MRAEFHIHTCASHDSMLGKHALVRACRRHGIGCVAITDHDEVAGALRFKPWLEQRGVQVIVGEEIFTAEGEIIGLWLKQRIEPGLTPEETVAQIKRQGGAVLIPHPYDEKRFRTVLDRDALMRIAGDIDCIEIHNGRNVDPRFDEEQRCAFDQVHAANPEVRSIVGSDAHCAFELGRNYIETSRCIVRDSFPDILDDAVLFSSPCHPRAHATTKVVRLVKMLSRGDFDALSRVFHRKLS